MPKKKHTMQEFIRSVKRLTEDTLAPLFRSHTGLTIQIHMMHEVRKPSGCAAFWHIDVKVKMPLGSFTCRLSPVLGEVEEASHNYQHAMRLVNKILEFYAEKRLDMDAEINQNLKKTIDGLKKLRNSH